MKRLNPKQTLKVCGLAALLHGFAPAAEPLPAPEPSGDAPLQRILFGNCLNQKHPQPIWKALLAAEPQLFLFLGDNIYADTQDMNVLRAKYQELADQPGYQQLRRMCPIMATWDDHDYGLNDTGGDYPMKRESQAAFLDFFGVPADSPRRQQEGVYSSRIFGPEGRRVQVLMLDTRYFRSPLKKGEPVGEPGEGLPSRYVPDDDPRSTLLGPAQWAWLEEQLRQPAELRIIASSIQVLPDEHGWEKWGNLPRERQRLLDLIRRTPGVLLVSGDFHTAEISVLEPPASGYPVVEVNAGSLNSPVPWRNVRNRYRVGAVYFGASFGAITIDWDAPDPVVRCQVRDEEGNVVLQQRTRLSELRAGATQR